MKKRKNTHTVAVMNAGNEPRLYQTSTFYDKEAAEVRYVPAKHVETSYVRTGTPYEGWFKK